MLDISRFFWVRSAQGVAIASLMALAPVGCQARHAAPSAGADKPAASEPAPAQEAGKKAGIPSTKRKVVRSAELSLEVASAGVAASRVLSLVERRAGYVESSERTVSADAGARQVERESFVIRVPAEGLSLLLRELKLLGEGAETERLGSEDVTDETIDLEARVANQRHLETQLVAILGQASTVDSALKVHQELANVRTEIDRAEGRRRFLATETELAKLSLTLLPLRPLVGVSLGELGVSVQRAGADSLSVAASLLTASIRVVGVLLPLTLMLGPPALAIWLIFRRRSRRAQSTLTA